MKRQILLIIFFIYPALSGLAQGIDKSTEFSIKEIADANQGNSYVTFPTDIGNIEPLRFEVNLIPNFYLRHNKSYRLMGVFTPQIILRMFNERSSPIRTPSYMPQLTLYYLLNNKESVRKLSLFGRLAHHSNGQDGPTILENGEINLKSGDFATNYFELGFLTIGNLLHIDNTSQFFKSSIEIHSYKEKLEGIYSKYRWNSAFSIFKLQKKNEIDAMKKTDISIRGETTWMFGKINNWADLSLRRLNLSLLVFYHPVFLEDFGLFAEFYHGSDYYNIYFNHKLDILRFGIMIEKLRF